MSDQTQPEKEQIIWVQGGINMNHEPFIQLMLARHKEQKNYIMEQLTPAQARDLAMNLLQAAESVETDSFLAAFFLDKVTKTFSEKREKYRKFMSFLTLFRQFRAKAGKQTGPVSKDDFTVTEDHQKIPKTDL